MYSGVLAVRKILFVMLLLLCQSCQQSDQASPHVYDDREVVVRLSIRPAGVSKEYFALATADMSHQIAWSWRRMRAEIKVATPAPERFHGFRVIERIPGFGASVVLLPDAYSDNYMWAAICDESSTYLRGAACSIKGNAGKWTVEVSISTDDLAEFDVIVDSLRTQLR